MHIKTLSVVALLGVATPVLAACGSDDNGDDSSQASTTPPAVTTTAKPPPATTTQPPATGRDLTVHMTEFAFKPKDNTAKAGKVTISAPNDGNVVHELVLLKTDTDPASLPKKGGEVDESTSVGEIADVPPGVTKKLTVKLAPGKYAMVCALPGHYEGGMYGSLTVS